MTHLQFQDAKMLTLPSFQSTFAKTKGEIIHQGPKTSALFSSLDKLLTGKQKKKRYPKSFKDFHKGSEMVVQMVD